MQVWFGEAVFRLKSQLHLFSTKIRLVQKSRKKCNIWGINRKKRGWEGYVKKQLHIHKASLKSTQNNPYLLQRDFSTSVRETPIPYKGLKYIVLFENIRNSAVTSSGSPISIPTQEFLVFIKCVTYRQIQLFCIAWLPSQVPGLIQFPRNICMDAH